MKENGKKEKKGTVERPLFETLRKPSAPPGHALGNAKPEERAHPAERKAKHKRRPANDDD